MFSTKKSPLKFGKPSSADPTYPVQSGSNPFDSDEEAKDTKKYNSSRKTSSEPARVKPELHTNPFDDYDGNGNSSSSSYTLLSAARNNYKNDFRDSGGLENQSVQELENYAVYKTEETTKSVNNCLKIAEDMREDATKTLVALHQQGEQITRTHYVAVDIDHDLSRGEKLLGSLGGFFSFKTWKPNKTHQITGPDSIGDDPVRRKASHLEQREKLGLTSAPAPRARSNASTPAREPTNALEKVEIEQKKQDDALSDLSNILGDLKNMAVDMGSEIDRQVKALDPLDKDVEELNGRMKGANLRGRHLLGR